MSSERRVQDFAEEVGTQKVAYWRNDTSDVRHANVRKEETERLRSTNVGNNNEEGR